MCCRNRLAARTSGVYDNELECSFRAFVYSCRCWIVRERRHLDVDGSHYNRDPNSSQPRWRTQCSVVTCFQAVLLLRSQLSCTNQHASLLPYAQVPMVSRSVTLEKHTAAWKALVMYVVVVALAVNLTEETRILT